MMLTVNCRNGRPKRSLSAYNYFFAAERGRLLASLPSRPGVKSKKAHGKISFAELGRTISARWKKISPKEKVYYAELAMKDKFRYLQEMEEWRASQESVHKVQKQQLLDNLSCPSEDGQAQKINDDFWEPIKLDLPSDRTDRLSPSPIPLTTSWNAFDFVDDYHDTSFRASASMEPSLFEYGRPSVFQTSFACCETMNTTAALTDSHGLARLAQALGEEGCSMLKALAN